MKKGVVKAIRTDKEKLYDQLRRVFLRDDDEPRPYDLARIRFVSPLCRQGYCQGTFYDIQPCGGSFVEYTATNLHFICECRCHE